MTSAMLKLFALICMIIDHLGAFILTDSIYLRWIGRLSAPIFLFVFVHSLKLSSDRIKLIKRLYCFNVIMCCLIFLWKSIFNINMFNNILASFVSVSVLIFVIEYCMMKKARWKLLLISYCIMQIALSIAILFLCIINLDVLAYVVGNMTASIFMNDGRVFFVILGTLLYFYQDSKKKYSIAYFSVYFCHSALVLLDVSAILYRVFRGTSLSMIYELVTVVLGYSMSPFKISPLYYHYDWMGVLALPIMWLYNGRKDRALAINKYFYYIFYPLHIAILSLIKHFF